MYVPSTVDDLYPFLHRLFEIGAVKVDTIRGFRMKVHETYPHAPLSPIYFNFRTSDNPKPGPLQKEDVKAVARFFYAHLKEKKVWYEGLCGVPRAGEPFARALQEHLYHADRISVPLLTLEKDENATGNTRRITRLKNAQELPRGSGILLIDDLITKARSKIEAIEVLRHEGYAVNHCVAFLDREQGGAKELRKLKAPVTISSVVGMQKFLNFLQAACLITTGEYIAIKSYLHQNK